MQDQKDRGNTGNVPPMICQPDVEGEVISEAEYGNFFCLLVAASNDSLRYTLSAVMYDSAVNSELLKMLHNSDKKLWNSAIEKFLRWASPTWQFRRTTIQDFELHGEKVREGDKMHLLVNLSQSRWCKVWCTIRIQSSASSKSPHDIRSVWSASVSGRVVSQAWSTRVAEATRKKR